MKELKDIIAAYQKAIARQLRMALATVVHVEGSSYRRPGARMLVTEEGEYTGAISGGCLEGDALRKAQLAIYDQKNKLVTYDTSDESNTEIGIQLGCNGVIHILFEPIDPEQATNPIALLSELVQARTPTVVATVFNLAAKRAPQIGTCFFQTATAFHQAAAYHSLNDPQALVASAKEQLQQEKSTIIAYENQHVFLEFIPPTNHLIIVGAGNDAQPLATIAHLLGWEITVVDGRFSHATVQRFPLATQIKVGKPNELIEQLVIDPYTVAVLMTHNYHYDWTVLKHLLATPVSYIGSLGPKVKLERMLTDLQEQGITLSEAQKEKIHGPVGLDIGAETSEQIAVAIIAEINAVLQHRNAGFLRDRKESIHQSAIVPIPSAHTSTATCSLSSFASGTP